jgi:UDP-N-acetylglucosamine 2-epimerase (non-hydrolysing)
MKAAPVIAAMKKAGGFRQVLVHTGQHYDENMSGNFFRDLGLPEPDINLGVGSGSHASQTAGIMRLFEPVLLERKPDWVVVYGDVNSTVACALVASKLGVKTAHVEAGLRSFDRTMPEEINRVVTDHLSDVLFVSEKSGVENLRKEGVDRGRIHLVGNVMIDTLVRLLPRARERFPVISNQLSVISKRKKKHFSGFILHPLDLHSLPGGAGSSFVLVTLHRPRNVDDPGTLKRIVKALIEVSKRIPVVFPVHPRTRKMLGDIFPDLNITAGCGSAFGRHPSPFLLLPPLSYLDFLALEANARLVVTDSGGIQEETSYLGVPCLTVRPNTERPVTVSRGTNELVSAEFRALGAAIRKRLKDGIPAEARRIPKWDGHAAWRIAEVFSSAM